MVFSRTKFDTLKYLGKIHSDKSTGCTIQLDEVWSKNDGSASEKLYFNWQNVRDLFHQLTVLK